MNQSEYETLMMAHDNLQRELSDVKRLMGKDKHALIKANIALNRRVRELEDLIEYKRRKEDVYYDCMQSLEFDLNRLEVQVKRYHYLIQQAETVLREAIESLDNGEKVQGLEWVIGLLEGEKWHL